MHIRRVAKSLIFACTMLPLTLSAQQQGKKVFGKGNPFTIEELPAGKLKAKLQTLDPQARDKAMKWLHQLTFHEFDAADHLRVDQEGGIFIVCPDGHGNCDGKNHKHNKKETSAGEASNAEPIEEDITKTTGTPDVAYAPVPISAPPAYNSKPGAPYHIYLDFNGALVSGKDWRETDDKGTTDTSDDITWSSWDCAAWSTDDDVSIFSDSEQAEMRRVWERVAEDYAPFNVNVTTDVAYDSVTYTGDKNKVGWLLFTNNTDNNGARCPHYGVGGVAYLGCFGESDYFSRNQPAWVLPATTANMAEAASHEMGHNLGLSHDGFPDPDPANPDDGNGAYYGGHAAVSGVATSWGPLMGTGYGRNVSQWSKASEYYGGNQTQDDLAIISARVPYRADDHGNAFGTATAWINGSVNQSGLIERTNDVDAFTFHAGAGTITLNASTYKCDTGTWGGNLDTILELYDSSLNLIASNNPADQVDSSLSVPVSAGRYYIMLKPAAAGDPLVSERSGYTVYGSLGQYNITGSYVSENGVILSYPGGGGTWYTGSIYNITWGSAMGGNVKIELLKAGSLHTTIAESTPNDGSYTWEVPSAQASGSDYKVRITSVEDPTKTDQSLADFSITADPLAVALDTEGLVWTTSGNLPWVTTITSHDGIDAARSGSIGHNQTSSMETTIIGPGTMTFWWRVSSELNYDFLRFYVNGVEQTGSISGEVSWVKKTVTIPSGSNVVKWSYIKDPAAVGGFDRAWVDEVVFTPTPVQVAVVPSNLSVPEGGSNTVAVSLSAQPSANVTVAVSRTAGDSDITVSAGSSLIFTTTNWATPQNATLAAAEDVDTVSSTATIALNADLAAVTDKTITATEADDAVTLTVAGGTGGTVNSVGLVDPDGGPFTITATPSVGYTFTSWSTTAGTVAASTSASTTINGFTVNTTVTATFSPTTYLVTYDGNGNTSGNPPAPQNKIHEVALSIPDNTGALAKTDFNFIGWNTEPNGTGTDYPAGSSYTANAPVTLYAKWMDDSVLIYESFSQTAGALNGKAGGTGLSGNWTATTSTSAVNVVAPATLNYGNLAKTGGQADLLTSTSTRASILTTSGLANAGLLNDGATIWFSYVFQKSAHGSTNEHSGFAFGTERVDPAFNGLNMLNSGYGLGVYTKDANLVASSWAGGTRTAGTSSSLQALSTPTLVIGKIVWGADASANETITIYTRALDNIGSEPTTGGGVRAVAAFDQTAVDTISFGQRGSGGTQTYDEIRFGVSFDDVVPPPPVASFAIVGIPAQVPVDSPVTGITITAKDVGGNTVTSFTGTVTFGGTAGITGTSANFVAGVLTGVSVTPTNLGAGRTLMVDDGASHTGTTTFDVQTIFANWSGGASVTADANNDGVANGLAWLFGAANPSVNARTLLPTFDNTTDADYFIYTYRRSDAAFNAVGTIIAVQYGSTLESWTTAVHDGTNIIITPTNDSYGAGVDMVEVKIKKTLAVSGKLFSRLRVVIAP